MICPECHGTKVQTGAAIWIECDVCFGEGSVVGPNVLDELTRLGQLLDARPSPFMRTTVPSFNGTTPPQAHHGIEE